MGRRSTTWVARSIALVVLLVTVAAGCGGTSSSTPSTDGGAVGHGSTEAPETTTTVDPALLPQTDEQPVAAGDGFDARSRALWDAVVSDDPARGISAFFPLAAYTQIKAVKDPAADWKDRLVADFGTDVHSLHRQLGAAAATATFVGMDVPDAAVWVTPGQEHNSGPYWRVYGSTLRYSVDGVEHTLPVESLISWRGQWYVVHLGPIR
jgi:hypothetical protein